MLWEVFDTKILKDMLIAQNVNPDGTRDFFTYWGFASRFRLISWESICFKGIVPSSWVFNGIKEERIRHELYDLLKQVDPNYVKEEYYIKVKTN